MNWPGREEETGEELRGTRGARLMHLIAIVLLAWSVIAVAAAWALASGRVLETIHPLKYQKHWDIRLCFHQAIMILPCAAIASLISFVVRPSWTSVILLLVAIIGWVLLFHTYLNLIT